MGFRYLRLFPFNGIVNGKPTYGPAIRLQGATSAEDFNAVELAITITNKSKTLNGDDKDRVFTKQTGYEVALQVYQIDPEACASIFGYETDENDNIIEVINGDELRFGVAFEGSTSTGQKYQKYLYDVKLNAPNLTAQSDSGEGTATITVNGNGQSITINYKEINATTVYKGNVGWVEGPATKMYLPGEQE